MIGKEEAILVARTLGKETKFWPKQSFKAARSETGIYTVPKLLHTPLPLVICFLNYPPLSVALVRVNLMWEMCVSQEEHAQLEPLLMYIIVGLVKALADGHSMLRPDWALVDDTEEELDLPRNHLCRAWGKQALGRTTRATPSQAMGGPTRRSSP